MDDFNSIIKYFQNNFFIVLVYTIKMSTVQVQAFKSSNNVLHDLIEYTKVQKKEYTFTLESNQSLNLNIPYPYEYKTVPNILTEIQVDDDEFGLNGMVKSRTEKSFVYKIENTREEKRNVILQYFIFPN